MTPNWFFLPGLLLDSHLSNLTTGFAIGLEKMRTAYTGYCLRVERESDGVIVDVAFDSSRALSFDSDVSVVSGSTNASNFGEFMTASGYSDVDSKGSGQEGLVIIAYDQINSNNFTQSTAGAKPKIVSSGVLLDGITFDGSNDYMLGMSSAIGTSYMTVYCEFEHHNIATTSNLFLWNKRLQGGNYDQISCVPKSSKSRVFIAESCFDANYYRDVSGTTTLSNNTMYKSKIKRVGTAITGYINGNSDLSANCYSTYNISNTAEWTLAKSGGYSDGYCPCAIKTLICGYSDFDITGAGY